MLELFAVACLVFLCHWGGFRVEGDERECVDGERLGPTRPDGRG